MSVLFVRVLDLLRSLSDVFGILQKHTCRVAVLVNGHGKKNLLQAGNIVLWRIAPQWGYLRFESQHDRGLNEGNDNKRPCP